MATFETYHALLTLTENNMRVIHWKLKGDDFDVVHPRYASYYEKLGEMMDETAEQMITMGHAPMNISNTLMHLGKDTDVDATIMNPELDYTSRIADETTYKMFNELYDFASHLAVDAALPADVQDVFMGHAKWFRTEGLYKLGRRVTVPTAPQETSSETVEVIPHAENPVIAQNHQVLNEEPDEDDEPLGADGSNNVPEDSERKSSMIEPMDDE